MFKFLLILLVCFTSGCGYTTRGFIYEESQIIIFPVRNSMDIASSGRRTSGYANFPILIENRLTSATINKFNIDGHLKVVNQAQSALELNCVVNNYTKEALRYTDSDDIKEQRLRLYVEMKLINSQGEVLQDKLIVGQASFFLSGSETVAQDELIEDTARRISEAVLEAW